MVRGIYYGEPVLEVFSIGDQAVGSLFAKKRVVIGAAVREGDDGYVFNFAQRLQAGGFVVRIVRISREPCQVIRFREQAIMPAGQPRAGSALQRQHQTRREEGVRGNARGVPIQPDHGVFIFGIVGLKNLRDVALLRWVCAQLVVYVQAFWCYSYTYGE